MIRAAAAVLLACAACVDFSGIGHRTAAGAVDEVTTDASADRLAELAAKVSAAAAAGALGDASDLAVDRLVAAAGESARREIDAMITVRLQAKLRETVRLSLDEALGRATQREVDAIREELVGPPLRADLDALIDAAAPHLADALQKAVSASITPVEAQVAQAKTEADQEAAKWRPIAIAFACGAGLLIVCLVLAVVLIRGHVKTIGALLRERT
jgi:hypothetical protein